MKFGTRFVISMRGETGAAGEEFYATSDNGQRVRTGVVAIATEVQYRQPRIGGLAELDDVGVYYAATRERCALLAEF